MHECFSYLNLLLHWHSGKAIIAVFYVSLQQRQIITHLFKGLVSMCLRKGLSWLSWILIFKEQMFSSITKLLRIAGQHYTNIFLLNRVYIYILYIYNNIFIIMFSTSRNDLFYILNCLLNASVLNAIWLIISFRLIVSLIANLSFHLAGTEQHLPPMTFLKIYSIVFRRWVIVLNKWWQRLYVWVNNPFYGMSREQNVTETWGQPSSSHLKYIKQISLVFFISLSVLVA